MIRAVTATQKTRVRVLEGTWNKKKPDTQFQSVGDSEQTLLLFISVGQSCREAVKMKLADPT